MIGSIVWTLILIAQIDLNVLLVFCGFRKTATKKEILFDVRNQSECARTLRVCPFIVSILGDDWFLFYSHSFYLSIALSKIECKSIHLLRFGRWCQRNFFFFFDLRSISKWKLSSWRWSNGMQMNVCRGQSTGIHRVMWWWAYTFCAYQISTFDTRGDIL